MGLRTINWYETSLDMDFLLKCGEGFNISIALHYMNRSMCTSPDSQETSLGKKFLKDTTWLLTGLVLTLYLPGHMTIFYKTTGLRSHNLSLEVTSRLEEWTQYPLRKIYEVEIFEININLFYDVFSIMFYQAEQE